MTAKTKEPQKQHEKIETIETSSEEKECFIITPIGSVGSETFTKTEGLIQSVLAPVLKKFGFTPLPAHYINKSGSINKQIIEKIVNCELVIANLTSVNPNVMYELAIRHSFGKSVITMAERGTKLPFDIVDQRTIFYDDSMKGVDEVKPLLETAIEIALANDDVEQKISNPIYDALNQFAQIKSLPAEQQDGFEIILERLDKIESQVISNIRQSAVPQKGFGNAAIDLNASSKAVRFMVRSTPGKEDIALDGIATLLSTTRNILVTKEPYILRSSNNDKFVEFTIIPRSESVLNSFTKDLMMAEEVLGYHFLQ
ncbi:hypothetical protein [Sphingobacterium paramultivorum]|uniref:hypothetical protein n=1 Tax=Sphingobacterium paramultivorum TaxID=2886510 RepID=UPI00129CCC16|nr:hypothetical protein [Sphingobacterium paramultivorum]